MEEGEKTDMDLRWSQEKQRWGGEDWEQTGRDGPKGREFSKKQDGERLREAERGVEVRESFKKRMREVERHGGMARKGLTEE